MNRNPESPQNPGKHVAIAPEKFEKLVVGSLQATDHKLENFVVTHRKKLGGSGGDYEFDAVVEFSALCGAQFTILVECKRHSRPVEREVINALYAKLQDVAANKAMVFSTSGFQSGAIEYATSKNIALLSFEESSFRYLTRNVNLLGTSPPWANLPAYVGFFVSSTKGGGISRRTIGTKKNDVLSRWIES